MNIFSLGQLLSLWAFYDRLQNTGFGCSEPGSHDDMKTLKLKRFSHLTALKKVHSTLLKRLFDHFSAHFAELRIDPPDPSFNPDEYVLAALKLINNPKTLPVQFLDALSALDDLSSPTAFKSIESAPEWPALKPTLLPDSSRQDIVLQLWLQAPELITKLHNRLRLVRLSSFEHASHPVPPGAQPPPVDPQDKLAILNLTMALDAWFANNNRGSETTRIEVYPIGPDFYFLIRHGGLFRHAAKVERQRTEFLHYRPERDDVVIYSPACHELRVNARSAAERNLYIAEFGAHFFGSPQYFSHRKTYSLEPLRVLGSDCLTAPASRGLGKIRLAEIEYKIPGENRSIVATADSDPGCLFKAGPNPIPQDSLLTRAIFEIQMAGSARFHPLEIKPPNFLKLSRSCDPDVIMSWLAHNQFRAAPVSLAVSATP
jgi:hypothetical protein